VTLQAIGAIAAALFAAVALVDHDPRRRAWAVLGAVVVTPVLLVSHVWDTPQFGPFRDRPAASAVLAVVGVAVIVAAGLLLARHPGWFPLAVAAAIPFRVPIESGGQTANLLVPLYAVIAAGAIAFVAPYLRRGARPDEAELAAQRAHERPAERPRAGLLEQLLAVAVILYAVQATYSSNFGHALEQVVFFYVPFALLFVLLARVAWTRALAARALAVLVGLALAFAAVGFVEEATHRVLLSSNAVDANDYQSYFRVSSLFYDPNIYGRFLAIVIVLVTGLVLWTRQRGRVLAASAVLVVLLAGLVLSLSQSSLAALLVGLIVLAALRWGAGRTALVAGGLVALGAAAILAAGGAGGVKIGDSKSLNTSSSGRFDLVRGGLDLFGERPVWGWGSGSFETQFRAQKESSRQRAASASHTIPVTVAAEQGAVGFLVYLALLAAALGRLLHDAFTSLRRSVVAAAFATLVFHTFLYAAFLEDPLAWALMGVGAALAWQLQPSPRERALARAERRAARAARITGPEPEVGSATAQATVPGVQATIPSS
jgi:putative inorganic carbon (HCO3(-)) transporter